VNYKILIVDDSKLARMAVGRALNNLHPEWTRLEASGAEEAIIKFNEHAPEFVLLDFNMPGKDGLALAAELRQLSPSTSVAVISANQQAEVIARAMAAGAGFLAKPLTEKALSEFLDAALARRGSAIQ
jgi:DNA-binding NarL/FixJ family response regulator